MFLAILIGKTDVSQSELDELIAVYVKMAADADNSKEQMLNLLNEQDLKNLLGNFHSLTYGEQNSLIAYLKRVEAIDPERVEKLRKYVNVSQEDQE